MTRLIYGLILAGYVYGISMVVQAQEPDPNELLCYSLALELLESEAPREEQVEAWRYLRCDEYDIAPAIAAFLGTKEMSERYK